MKSIIEEASSISKAIEKAWERAGKPNDFSIKIYQEPEHHMFGFVKNPAKIGLFFDEIRKGRPEKTEKWVAPPVKAQTPASRELRTPQDREPRKKEFHKEVWTNDMVKIAEEWIKRVCILIGLPHIGFTTSISGNFLKVRFEAPVTGDSKKERMLFSSFAHLIMQTIRNKAKKRFKNLKIILMSA